MSDLPSQSDRLHDREWDLLVIMDAGRADVLDDVLNDGGTDLTAESGTPVERVHNGGVGFTANWMAHHFDGAYPDTAFFHGGQPIYSMGGGADWDERDHFGTVPPWDAYEWDDDLGTCHPSNVGQVVQETIEPSDRAVVRLLCPHPPFPNLVEYTRGRGNRTRKIAQAVRSGELAHTEVRGAYKDWYAAGLWTVAQLADWHDGHVAVTADHGECLGDCGQWFHGPIGDGGHDPHDHLVDVPWVVIDDD